MINHDIQPDDFAVINQGQLKSLAKKAYDELESKYANHGGAGAELDLMIQAWTNSSNNDDFAVATIGQIKQLSLKYHERLLAIGAITVLPTWLNVASGEDDYAVANIGQAKQAFSFEIPSLTSHLSNISDDESDGANNVLTTTSDIDGDDISNSDEERFGLNQGFADTEASATSQGFVPDALGRLKQVTRVSPHVYVIDDESNILSVNN